MKTYIFTSLSVGVLRDGFNTILVQAGKANIDETKPAIVALAEKHGGKPEQIKKSKTKRGNK